jgi:hypothetical protein
MIFIDKRFILLMAIFVSLLSACNNETESIDDNSSSTNSVASEVSTKGTKVTVQTETALAKRAVSTFAGKIKENLSKAIQESGPMKALRVCNHKMPKLTAHLSDVYGKQLSRVSLKYRNPNNAPDEWQREILEDFETRKALGENVKLMAYAEIVTHQGQKQFRFMTAIPTENSCLTCHGTTLSPKLHKRINTLYPKDKAIGYEQGDIRGAFVFVNNLR